MREWCSDGWSVLASYSKTIYFLDKGQQFATAVDFGLALETALNTGKKREVDRIHIAFIPTGRDRLIPALNEGLGDIVMANLTITPGRLEQVDFTIPIYDKASEAKASWRRHRIWQDRQATAELAASHDVSGRRGPATKFFARPPEDRSRFALRRARGDR